MEDGGWRMGNARRTHIHPQSSILNLRCSAASSILLHGTAYPTACHSALSPRRTVSPASPQFHEPLRPAPLRSPAPAFRISPLDTLGPRFTPESSPSKLATQPKETPASRLPPFVPVLASNLASLPRNLFRFTLFRQEAMLQYPNRCTARFYC